MRRALVALAALALPAPAWAQWEPGRVTLVAVTDAPVHLGGGVAVGLGRRLRVRSVVGAMIPPYLDLVHLAVEAGAALPASQSAALREAVSSAVAWRTQLAWRPMPARGLELALGYGLVVIFGDVTPGLAYSVANVPSSVRVSPPPVPYGVTAWLHQADVEAAWRWTVSAGVAVRAGLGAGVTFANATTIAPRYGSTGESELARGIRQQGEATVTEWFTRWRLLPWASLALEIEL